MDAQKGDAEVVDFGRRRGDDFEDCIPKLCVCVCKEISQESGMEKTGLELCYAKAEPFIAK